MNKSLEDGLRQFVVALGHIVEKIIGQAKSARKRVDMSRGLRPVLSLDSQLSPSKIMELIDTSSSRIIDSAIPNLENHRAIEIGENASSHILKIIERKPEYSLAVELNPTTSVKGQHKFNNIKANAHRLPLAEKTFSYAIARYATPFQSDFSSSVQELSRILKEGSKGIVVDYHPYGIYSQKGTPKLHASSSTIRGVQDYYRVFARCGLRVIEIREAWIDESLRASFAEEEISTYRAVKGTPLAIYLFFYKPKKK